MAVIPRLSRISQFWLPGLLFILSVGSILFTFQSNEIPVLGPNERSVVDASDLESHRQMIGQALQKSGSWRSWCENPELALQTVRFAHFDQGPSDGWEGLRRSLRQSEQDALLRCQNPAAISSGSIHGCLFLKPKFSQNEASASLHLIELKLELRALGRKTGFSCAEALAATSPSLEMVAWYTYYWAPVTGKKTLRFQRLTGGTRIFPAVAQNDERPTAASRP